MRELYHEKRMSQQDIADHFDNEITQAGIGCCLNDLGIEKRSRSESARIRWSTEPPVMYTQSQNGYEVVAPREREQRRTLLIHRLLAVHKYGFEDVKDKVVHHKNGIRWDNRVENIELMTRSEHVNHHHHETSVAEGSL